MRLNMDKRMKMRSGQRSILAAWICLASLMLSCSALAEAVSRKLNTTDPMPKLSLVDSQGQAFEYNSADGTVLLVAFFSPEKTQSLKAIEDIEAVLTSLQPLPGKLTLLAVSDDPNAIYQSKLRNSEELTVRFIIDSDFKLWGQFGVIASPTVFLAGTDGRIELIRPGYGYDFAPVIKSHLQTVMGMTPKTETNHAQVKTVMNDSVQEKANRHLKMAQLLESRGSYDAARIQLETAVKIDPNSLECALELGRLYCMTADPHKAIDAVKGLQASDRAQQAARAFVLGKAYSLLNEFSQAEVHLLAAVELDPEHSQAFYELGKLYHLQKQSDKALESYRKALDLVFRSRK